MICSFLFGHTMTAIVLQNTKEVYHLLFEIKDHKGFYLGKKLNKIMSNSVIVTKFKTELFCLSWESYTKNYSNPLLEVLIWCYIRSYIKKLGTAFCFALNSMSLLFIIYFVVTPPYYYDYTKHENSICSFGWSIICK